MVANIFSITGTAISTLLHLKVYISLHTQAEKGQITVTLTGRGRIVGPEYETCFVSSFWYLEFEGMSYILGKFVDSRSGHSDD